MELQDIAVHTCGICEIIIEEKNIPTHSCIEGYNRLLIDENFYFYPVTDDDGIVRRSLVDNEDVILPVREHITGKLSGEEAKKKFKNLHDVYRRIIHSENHPSGSARPSPTQKWHHYDSMEFLRDLCLVKKGKASNIDTDDDTSSIGESINNATGDGNNDEELEVLGAPKKKKNMGQQPSALERIADSLCQPPTPFVIPSAPKPDEIDSTLAVIGCRLRLMNRKNQLDVIQRIMNLTYNVLQKED
ncbi:uncharacterized protein [Linepithema humile]|uniref:uncharacterized protein n=1 Tax=Linepithema humile TaxID=83485 RepID=UPI00351DCB8B